MKIKILSLLILIALAGTFTISCNKDDDDTVGTCSDGIKNQGEEDVDCGGPCTSCIQDPMMKASVSGFKWTAVNIAASNGSGSFSINADNNSIPMWVIKLVHKGPRTAGTYALDASTVLTDISGTYHEFKGGTITFTKFDASKKLVSGTFSFKAQGPLFLMDVTDGEFTAIPYN
jgi:hypothetical protein